MPTDNVRGGVILDNVRPCLCLCSAYRGDMCVQEFRQRLVNRMPEGSNLTVRQSVFWFLSLYLIQRSKVIVDACHSGTMLGPLRSLPLMDICLPPSRSSAYLALHRNPFRNNTPYDIAV